MDKEESFLKNRFSDLANSSYNRNIYTYTDFLNLNEISILNSYKNQLPPVNVELAGGNDYAERRITVFSPVDIYYTQDLPIKLIEIAPINSHYADKLSHRDVLGAILNLGIVRNKIGDIFLKDNQAYVYCMDDISQERSLLMVRWLHLTDTSQNLMILFPLGEKADLFLKDNLE